MSSTTFTFFVTISTTITITVSVTISATSTVFAFSEFILEFMVALPSKEKQPHYHW
jgi:hypothetical protein